MPFHSLFSSLCLFLKHSHLSTSTEHPIMTLVKCEGSSRQKGKEIGTNNPATKTVGEDTPLSESEYSGEEEVGRYLDSECASLINPWYDTHMHFPMVPSDYLLHRQVICGSLFAIVTQRCLGSLWLLLSPISIYAKETHSPCPFSSNLSRVLLWF